MSLPVKSYPSTNGIKDPIENNYRNGLEGIKSQLFLISGNQSIPEMIGADTNDLVVALIIGLLSTKYVQNRFEDLLKGRNKKIARPMLYPSVFFLGSLYQGYISPSKSGLLSNAYTMIPLAR